MNTNSPLKICLLRLSAIGDTCNVVPTVLQLQETFPNSTITWVIGAVEHRLLGALPGVEFIIVDKGSDKKALRALYKTIGATQYDVLLHMHASMRANLLSRHIRAARKIGFDRARARDFQTWFCNDSIEAREKPHVVEGFLQFAQHLGAPSAPPKWQLPTNKEADAFAQDILTSRSMVISPCSSDRRRNFRNWSIDNYALLAQHANEHYGLDVVLTGGETELERNYGEAISAKAPVKNLIGKTSLPQLLCLLARAEVVVCPDSGPAHMANAAGTPVIGLFATSNRLRTGPYLSQAYAVDRYPDALKQYLNKTIEEVKWGQRVRDPNAMSLIAFDDVAARLKALMDTKS